MYNMLNKPENLFYSKKDNKESNLQVLEMPVDIVITDLHYYILHPDCLTILS